VLVHAIYIRPRYLPQLQNSTAPQKQHSLQKFWFFGCYLLPLAVLELYLRAKESAGPSGRFAMAGGPVVLTALMGVGIFGVATFMWRPLREAMK
jgi:hypothetical protein